MSAKGNAGEYNLTSSYGDCIAIYRGEGTLSLQNEQTIPCDFEAGQLRSGSVLIICRFSQHFDIFNIPAHRFDGRTVEGFRISSIENMLFLDAHITPPGITATFAVRELVVHTSENIRVQSVRFGITNFLFAAPITLVLEHVDSLIEISIEPVKNYEVLARRLRVLKTIDVTCEVVGNIALDGNVERLEEAVENLCYLLSVARGTKIQWIYCDRYNEEGILLSRRHGTRVTKAYCPLYILDQNNNRETKAFIDGTYSSYVANYNRYEFDGGTIDAYLDAKAENDYLELRGIKLAVAMEALKAVFLKQPDFRKHLKTRSATFKDILIRLFDSIRLNVDGDDLDLFVKCRNSLVHQGRFYCQTATTEEQAKVTPLPTQVEEYYFLLNFVDRVFLVLLSYRGPYINMRSPGNPIHQEQV